MYARLWRARNKEKCRIDRTKLRMKNREGIKAQERIRYWRQKQKELALQYFQSQIEVNLSNHTIF